MKKNKLFLIPFMFLLTGCVSSYRPIVFSNVEIKNVYVEDVNTFVGWQPLSNVLIPAERTFQSSVYYVSTHSFTRFDFYGTTSNLFEKLFVDNYSSVKLDYQFVNPNGQLLASSNPVGGRYYIEMGLHYDWEFSGQDLSYSGNQTDYSYYNENFVDRFSLMPVSNVYTFPQQGANYDSIKVSLYFLGDLTANTIFINYIQSEMLSHIYFYNEQGETNFYSVDGYARGYLSGYNNGKDDGYALGVVDGASGNSSTNIVFTWIGSTANAINNMLKVEVLPNISLWTILLFPIVLGAFAFFIKWALK